jgi:hypothetical protein
VEDVDEANSEEDGDSQGEEVDPENEILLTENMNQNIMEETNAFETNHPDSFGIKLQADPADEYINANVSVSNRKKTPSPALPIKDETPVD